MEEDKKCDGNCGCEHDKCSSVAPVNAEAEKIIQELLDSGEEIENKDEAERFINELLTEVQAAQADPCKKVFPTLRDDAGKKLGRNDPCPCGSDKKWKKCCLKSF